MRVDPLQLSCHWLFLIALCLLAACNSPASGTKSSGSADHSQATAVYSKANDSYVRTKNADGSFQPESYELVMGKGQNNGKPGEARAVDTPSLDDVSRAIAAPLALQDYMPSEDPSTTDLLIVVYWGTTELPVEAHPNEVVVNRVDETIARKNPLRRDDFNASNGLDETTPSTAEALKAKAFPLNSQVPNTAQIESRVQDARDARTDSRNAAILGYTDAFVQVPSGDPGLDALRAEIEERRYYVVLLAYDYEAAKNQGHPDLLWEAHFSIPVQGNDFRKSLAAMAHVASKYFGVNSHGLIHYDLKTGRVEIGEPKALGTVP